MEPGQAENIVKSFSLIYEKLGLDEVKIIKNADPRYSSEKVYPAKKEGEEIFQFHSRDPQVV